MYYRILTAPPGYGPDENYMVGIYETLEYDSCLGSVRKPDGSRFAAALEEAREMLPADARRLPFTPEDQFLELWEGSEL